MSKLLRDDGESQEFIPSGEEKLISPLLVDAKLYIDKFLQIKR